MKKIAYVVLAATILLTSCGTSGQMQGNPNPNAMAAGAMVGGSMGSLIGGVVGSNNNGWWGGRRGSAIGTVVGSIAGAAIGGAVSSAQSKAQSTQEYVEVVEKRPRAPRVTSNISGLRISNIRFIDESHSQTINADENSKLIFDIVNESNRTVYNVVPVVEELTGNKQISISPSTMIGQIAPGAGMRYTAHIYAGKRLHNGQVSLRIILTDSNGIEGDCIEFDLETQN